MFRGGELVRELPPEQLRQLVGNGSAAGAGAGTPGSEKERKETVAWLDLTDPPAEELERVATAFNFHPVLIEDCRTEIEFPKIDTYEEHILIVFHSMRLMDGSDDFAAPEVDIIVGKHYVITVHRHPMPRTIDSNWTKMCGDPRWLSRGADLVVLALLETAIEQYPPVLSTWEETLDEVEVDILNGKTDSAPEIITAQKRRLYAFRRKISPQREILLRLSRGEYPVIGKKAVIYYRDLYDSAFRSYQLLEEQLARTNSAFEIYLTSINNRMAEINNQTNIVVQRLTIVNLIFLPLMFIASIYGMNFDPDTSRWNMPELRWIYGYPAALGLMAVTAVGLLMYFKKRRWI